MGITPRNYISKYRLRMAIGYIIDGIPINEIDTMVGYEDSKAFSRFFKKHTGVAPSEYMSCYSMKIQP